MISIAFLFHLRELKTADDMDNPLSRITALVFRVIEGKGPQITFKIEKQKDAFSKDV